MSGPADFLQTVSNLAQRYKKIPQFAHPKGTIRANIEISNGYKRENT